MNFKNWLQHISKISIQANFAGFACAHVLYILYIRSAGSLLNLSCLKLPETAVCHSTRATVLTYYYALRSSLCELLAFFEVDHHKLTHIWSIISVRF